MMLINQAIRHTFNGNTMKVIKKILPFLILGLAQACDCHYQNSQNYVRCLEKHKGNENYCVKIRSKYSGNSCNSIDYESEDKKL